MSLQRSQSVPHSIGHVQPGLPRSVSHQQLPRNTYKPSVKRTASVIGTSSLRKDPFSLTGFFPTSRSTDSEEWSWLREERDDEEDEERHETTDEERWPKGSVMSRQGNEELTRVIRDQDKMGVLSIGTDEFSWKKTDDNYYGEERLVSPYYSKEEAVDFESLYETLQGLRRRGEVEVTKSEARYGELFLKSEETWE